MTPHKITELFAWVATDQDGTEGVCGQLLPSNTLMPMIGSDRDRIESLRPAAEEVRRLTGFPVKLMRFSMASKLEDLP